MGDDIDSLVEKHLPALTQRALKGMKAVKPALAAYLPVTATDDPSPFRLGPVATVPAEGSDALQRLTTTVEAAYEFERSYELDLETLRSAKDQVLDGVERFGTDVRLLERRAVLSLIAAGATPGGAYNTTNVTDHAKRHAGSVRLLGAGEVAAAVKKAGAVEEVVPLPEVTPPGVAALLVPLTGGPVLERVVDDLTVSWRRLGADKARLIVRGRFFLDRPDSALRFTQSAD